ncbi:hypothetical protein BDZ97DRAFT_1812236, partial [Flammula alnicola]
MFSQLFVAAFLAVSAQTALAADCTRSYTIQAGDYCDKISQAQNVSTYQLAVVNSGSVNSACTNLIPGQSLCLAQKATEDCSTTYVVLADDTCAGIASKNALNTTILPSTTLRSTTLAATSTLARFVFYPLFSRLVALGVICTFTFQFPDASGTYHILRLANQVL